jgi:hypothetical protein
VHVALDLTRVDALVPCDAPRLVNRYVRPLLRALTKAGALAHYFGRDWVSCLRRPAALVGFAHDATTGRASFEAVVGVSECFALGPRTSFMGKAPASLLEVVGHDVDPRALARGIADAYVTAYSGEAGSVALADLAAAAAPCVSGDEPPWAATTQEAIGLLGAGPDASGRWRVGGELQASRDAITRLESRLAEIGVGSAVAEAREDEARAVEGAIDDAFAARGVALDGVRSLRSIADVVRRAR